MFFMGVDLHKRTLSVCVMVQEEAGAASGSEADLGHGRWPGIPNSCADSTCCRSAAPPLTIAVMFDDRRYHVPGANKERPTPSGRGLTFLAE